ncbi:MAG: helix-turn-helix domain-containing protein [Bacteroidota bacterium]
MTPVRIKTISEFHALRGLPKPEHPLISVIKLDSSAGSPDKYGRGFIMDFYSISIKRSFGIKYKYGQQEYDFNEGVMFFMAPNQVYSIEINDNHVSPEGWILLIHPDFLWNTPLATTMRKYEFFDYSVYEALFMSDKEEQTMNNIILNIQHEYHSNIDKFTQGIIISQLETLLNYSERFYQRQFITRNITNHKVLDSLEKLLDEYFNSVDLASKGLPTVQYISEKLNISPTYLRSLLKMLTGQNTQQHIHDKVIAKAKEKLSTTDLSVSEIAYELGFEHPQSFSKFFKTKTHVSPLEFRASFN